MMISSRTLLSFTFPPNQLGRMAALTIFNGSDRLNVPSQAARQPALRTDIACLHEPSSRRTSGVIGSRRASSDGRFGAHPGRIASKRGHTNAGEALLAWLVRAPSAKLLRMTVGDSGGGQRLRERRLIELGISPRAREAAHVDQGFGARLQQTGDELFGGTGAMTDSEDVHATRIARVSRS